MDDSNLQTPAKSKTERAPWLLLPPQPARRRKPDSMGIEKAQLKSCEGVEDLKTMALSGQEQSRVGTLKMEPTISDVLSSEEAVWQKMELKDPMKMASRTEHVNMLK